MTYKIKIRINAGFLFYLCFVKIIDERYTRLNLGLAPLNKSYEFCIFPLCAGREKGEGTMIKSIRTRKL
jgi:hypothetical protein